MNIFEEGIDVSKYQGTIDFQEVKKSGKGFVILHAGFGRDISQKDPCFETFYYSAKAAHLNVGAYWFSYAVDADDAEKEAYTFIQAINEKQFEYPVYMDLEWDNQLIKGIDFCSSLVESFCGTLQKNGYFTGLYMSRSPLQTYIYPETAKKYSLWVAEYGDSCTYEKSYDMWQKSGQGNVNGICGDVDLDVSYKNFPDIIKKAGLNGF